MLRRGKVLELSRMHVVARALGQILAVPTPPPGAPADAGNRPIAYRLDDSGLLGGRDPDQPHCADWSYGLRTPTADCVGFALWASGIDRRQPGYNGLNGQWLNTDSLLADADGEQKFCRPLRMGEAAKPGDWLISASRRVLFKRVPGHIGVIVRPSPGAAFEHLVVDCSPRHGRDTAINTGGPWSKACRVIRPLFLADV
jgi:hypothetical protein